MTTLPSDDPRMRAWRLRRHADALWDLGRFAEAAQAVYESLNIEPDSARAYCTLAQAQSGMGRTDEALRSAQQACALDPSLEHGHRLRAIYHGRRGEGELAVAAAREAVRLAPEDDMTLSALSDAFKATGDLEEAMRVALRICEVTPESVWAYERCGNIALARKGFAEAEAYFRRGLALDPQHNVCLANLGWALEGQKRYREAIECLAETLRLHPDDPHADRVRQQLRYTIFLSLKDGEMDALPAALQQWYAAQVTPN